MSTSMGHDLTHNDPEQRGGRRYDAEESAAYFHSVVSRTRASAAAWSERMRAKREAKQRRDERKRVAA